MEGEFKIRPLESEEWYPPKKKPELKAQETLDAVIEGKDIPESLKEILLLDVLISEIKKNKDYKNSEAYLSFLNELENNMEFNKELSAALDANEVPKITKGLKQMLNERYGVKNIALPQGYETVILDPLTFFVVEKESQTTLGSYASSLRQSFILVEDENEEKFESRLTTVLSHELIHALSNQNHWEINFQQEKPFLLQRRVGILTRRITKVSKKPAFFSTTALNELNEAVTEKLSVEYLTDFLEPSDKIKEVLAKKQSYFNEQFILYVINEKIPFKLFAKAQFEKDSFRDLIREINKTYGSRSATIISELMNWENKIYKLLVTPPSEEKYPLTADFLNGKPIKVPFHIFQRVKPETAAKHPLISIL